MTGCQKLVILALPLVSNQLPSYYRNLIARFPNLVDLTVHAATDYTGIWNLDLVLKLFTNSPKLEFIHFISSGCHWPKRHFVRKDLEKILSESRGIYLVCGWFERQQNDVGII